MRAPYRPVPRDFEDRWPEIGWGGAAEEWRCHSRTIDRWLTELGKDRMILRRAQYLAAQRKIRDRARRKSYRLPPANDAA